MLWQMLWKLIARRDWLGKMRPGSLDVGQLPQTLIVTP